ncbi:MAG: hypothetical protein ABSE49_30520 [Polyangiaceae bacterium]|jgi:hypothetical protein
MGAAPQSTTLVYRGSGPVGTVFVLVFMLLVGSGIVTSVFQKAATVTFDCSRASGECVTSWRYPIGWSRTEVQPLSSIKSTKLDAQTDRHGSTYALQLESIGGNDIPISTRYGELGPRARQKQAIDAFLTDPKETTLHVEYDAATFSPAEPISLGVFFLVVGYVIGIRSRLRFDAASRMLHIERGTWWWTRRRQSVPLGEIQGFDLETEDSRGETTYRPVVVLGGGRRIPLLGMVSVDERTHEDALSRMRAAYAAAFEGNGSEAEPPAASI